MPPAPPLGTVSFFHRSPVLCLVEPAATRASFSRLNARRSSCFYDSFPHKHPLSNGAVCSSSRAWLFQRFLLHLASIWVVRFKGICSWSLKFVDFLVFSESRPSLVIFLQISSKIIFIIHLTIREKSRISAASFERSFDQTKFIYSFK